MSDDAQYGNKCNCYVYAAKCWQNKVGQIKVAPDAVPQQGAVGAKEEKLKDGVIADANADNNKTVMHLGTFTTPFNDLVVPDALANEYLICMLTNKNGFHFMRRQKKKKFGTPCWKWKSGNGGKVERNAFTPSGNSVSVTNANLKQFILSTTDDTIAKDKLLVKGTPLLGNVQRIDFFSVPQDGFKVYRRENWYTA